MRTEAARRRSCGSRATRPIDTFHCAMFLVTFRTGNPLQATSVNPKPPATCLPAHQPTTRPSLTSPRLPPGMHHDGAGRVRRAHAPQRARRPPPRGVRVPPRAAVPCGVAVARVRAAVGARRRAHVLGAARGGPRGGLRADGGHAARGVRPVRGGARGGVAREGGAAAAAAGAVARVRGLRGRRVAAVRRAADAARVLVGLADARRAGVQLYWPRARVPLCRALRRWRGGRRWGERWGARRDFARRVGRHRRQRVPRETRARAAQRVTTKRRAPRPALPPRHPVRGAHLLPLLLLLIPLALALALPRSVCASVHDDPLQRNNASPLLLPCLLTPARPYRGACKMGPWYRCMASLLILRCTDGPRCSGMGSTRT
ncbi:unnamed protein product [Chondrus crispus]|uniref:Uncharacterized protein n=1 Tax=Chondrus crispus TaxID=2769 RepID=R7QB63_CHOCR|nr:unnamed protein product [Chondrus crispus]CDF35314.1 unnamed protein product [Chondrus crispus]|eukprot:XP_005715133.1 unnamed protein product [Chondrus crispus]